MKNFKVHFSESEREAVLNILTRSNDIILNQLEPEAASITIQLDDDHSDLLYNDLLAQIDREVRNPPVVVVVSEEIIVERISPVSGPEASRTDRS